MYVGRGVIAAAVAVGYNIAGSWDIDSCETQQPHLRMRSLPLSTWACLRDATFQKLLRCIAPPGGQEPPYVIEQRVPTDEKNSGHTLRERCDSLKSSAR